MVSFVRYAIGLKSSRQFFYPIRSKTKTNRDSLARVFPRFASATCNYFEFWLVHCIACVLCDWLEKLLWFWFYDTQLKTAVIDGWDFLFYAQRLCMNYIIAILLLVSCISAYITTFINGIYYIDTSVLLENTPLVKFIRNYILYSSGLFYISLVKILIISLISSLSLKLFSNAVVYDHNISGYSLKVFGNLRKVVENLREIVKNAVISMSFFFI